MGEESRSSSSTDDVVLIRYTIYVKHPCLGKKDVSCVTCLDFRDSWAESTGAAGLLRRRGMTYGEAFLNLYLPSVSDQELAKADDARAFRIILERYMA